MAKKKTDKAAADMTSLEMPAGGRMMAMMRKAPGPEYPCLSIQSKEEIDLPDGDFRFEAIGHVKRREEYECEDDTTCYSYGIDVISIKPMESVPADKSTDKPGDIADGFDKAANDMISLKEEDDSKDEPDDDEDDGGD